MQKIELALEWLCRVATFMYVGTFWLPVFVGPTVHVHVSQNQGATVTHGQTDSRQNTTLVQVCLTSILNYNNQCSVACLRFHSLSELAHDYQ